MIFPLRFGQDVEFVSKIKTGEFTSAHLEVVSGVKYADRSLAFPDPGWKSTLLGAGEEKAVFCVRDGNKHVFALEVIDQRTYLDGRFVGGEYFGETRVSGLGGTRFNPNSLVGLTFTGLVKAREFVYGYEWARFQFSPHKHSWLDGFLTAWLQSIFSGEFNDYRAHYKDVHDRNVMFEIREPGAPGAPVWIKDWSNRTRFAKIGIQPIDVR